MNRHGRRPKRCDACNASERARHSAKCSHGVRRGNCADCHLEEIAAGNFFTYCSHGRRPWRCAACSGGSMCPCGRQRHSCRDCSRPTWLVTRCAKRACEALGGGLPCPILELLDVESPEAFLCYIERLMAAADPPLLWDQYASSGPGGWQLDHIEAVKSPVDTPNGPRLPNYAEMIARCHHTNIRPLDTVEHLGKTIAEIMAIREVRAGRQVPDVFEDEPDEP
jgi:hypothetical protein